MWFHLIIAQAAVPQQLPGMSQFDTTLIGAIVSVVVGIAGLVTWVIRSGVPRVLTAFEKRNDALVAASEKTADAVSKIPEAIKSFEVALLGAEKRLAEEVRGSQDKIVKELHDNRIADLARAVNDRERISQVNPQVPKQ